MSLSIQHVFKVARKLDDTVLISGLLSLYKLVGGCHKEHTNAPSLCPHAPMMIKGRSVIITFTCQRSTGSLSKHGLLLQVDSSSYWKLKDKKTDKRVKDKKKALYVERATQILDDDGFCQKLDVWLCSKLMCYPLVSGLSF